MIENDGKHIRDVGSALKWAAAQLDRVAERPYLEAERLLSALVQKERVALLAHPEWRLRKVETRLFRDAVLRRASGVPLPHLLGRVEFMGLEFVVTPDVLVPRPETELLVERGTAWLKEHAVNTVVDVGTGSGCIAAALAVAIPSVRILGLDLSAEALSVARTNVLRHNLGRRVALVRGDLLTPIRAPIDLIVSNPPYVASSEWTQLPSVVRQEPRMALLAGPEGLDVIERLLRQAQRRLACGGCMLIEIGETQGEAVRTLARTAFRNARISILPDLAGKDRVLQVLR
ncbi:MAG: peptide chain release factor N(5)-glutamine methyltransferase [Anaerolineae bacterium]